MAVTRNDIIDALSGKFEKVPCHDWLRVVEQYPFCEIFVWHYLRALYRSDDLSFDNELQRLGIRLGDRQEFYRFMIRQTPRESLFSYQTASSDYFAGKEHEGVSLTELARKLREARMGQPSRKDSSFCTPDHEKNDIRKPHSDAPNAVSTPLESTFGASDMALATADVADAETDNPTQETDSLQIIRAKITSLIMQKKYSEALEILKRENFANSKKNAYFAVQIKYLETIINNK